jgi:hypothetical protein
MHLLITYCRFNYVKSLIDFGYELNNKNELLKIILATPAPYCDPEQEYDNEDIKTRVEEYFAKEKEAYIFLLQTLLQGSNFGSDASYIEDTNCFNNLILAKEIGKYLEQNPTVTSEFKESLKGILLRLEKFSKSADILEILGTIIANVKDSSSMDTDNVKWGPEKL